MPLAPLARLLPFAAFASILAAQQAPPDVILEPIAEGVPRPTGIADPGDGSGRLFFSAQGGQIWVYDGSRVLPEPFLDITPELNCCGETGLLNLAFDPDFATNGRFYISYTSNKGGPYGTSTISSLQVSSDDPNKADPASEKVLLSFDQPTYTHNAGQIAFGPDGMLYAAFGDGGLPNYDGGPWVSRELDTLLGKIIRIDVNGGDPYAIPPDNPFVDQPGARGEIYLLGLRNPWRFSFDRDTGDLFIADVGAGTLEEVELLRAGARGGVNYGWPYFEGDTCTFFDPACDDSGITGPVFGLTREPDTCRAITGGFRYRGLAMPALQGRYVFADWCTGELWAAQETPDGWQIGPSQQINNYISTFGQDSRGELYAGSFSAGVIYRLRTAWPHPELSPLAPARTLSGGQGFRMTLVGSGFVPGSEALWDGEPLQAELIDNQRMQVEIGSERIAQPGVHMIEIRNPAPNPGPSTVQAFTVDEASGVLPVINDGGVVGAARLQIGPLAPGHAFSIFGDDLAEFAEQALTTPLPTSLGGITVRRAEGEAIPLLYASPTQINAVAPWGLTPGEPLEIYIERGSARGESMLIETAPANPGVFTLSQSGSGQAAALIAGQGILAAPSSTAPGARPVHPGEAIEVYMTGLGAVYPAVADGRAPGPGLSIAFEDPVVRLKGVPARVLFAGLAPGFVGLYQVNVEIPQDAPTGDEVPLEIAARGVFANAVTIAVQ